MTSCAGRRTRWRRCPSGSHVFLESGGSSLRVLTSASIRSSRDGHLEEILGDDVAAQGLPESGVALQGVGYVLEGVDGGGRWGAGVIRRRSGTMT